MFISPFKRNFNLIGGKCRCSKNFNQQSRKILLQQKFSTFWVAIFAQNTTFRKCRPRATARPRADRNWMPPGKMQRGVQMRGQSRTLLRATGLISRGQAKDDGGGEDEHVKDDHRRGCLLPSLPGDDRRELGWKKIRKKRFSFEIWKLDVLEAEILLF